MAIKINFDAANVPENPTFILANRSGNMLGLVNAKEIVIKDCMNDSTEASFVVYKNIDGVKDTLWDRIKDFKLVYCKEINMWFEIKVSIEESENTKKNVSCIQLGQAELSQVILYDIQINTEDDIARDDYKEPTVFYNDNNHSASLLHRIMDKAKHYSILHVDPTIANIQRTFEFNDKSLYDAMQEIAEEIGCLFVFHSDNDENGKIRRAISVYDLQSYCYECGHREEFTNICPECGSTNISEGYGNDTTIFITSDELGKNIKFETDTDKTKNCFKLQAGDDLMTATIRNCNPNGSDYIWYISDDVKEDMSVELVSKIDEYNKQYKYYRNEHSIHINDSLLKKYNYLVDKYYHSNKSLKKIFSPITGYSNLMEIYYQVVDLSSYLQSGLLPSVELSSTNAIKEADKLNKGNLSPISVASTEKISLATANSAILSVAKCIVNPNYKVKIGDSHINKLEWTGNFIVTNYSDDEDTATSEFVTLNINGNYENFVYQKIQKVLSQDKGDINGIVELFDSKIDSFKTELKKYNLDSLNSFWNSCQSCIDLLIEQGIADKDSWDGKSPNLYDDLYLLYYNKLKAIEEEQVIRQSEIDVLLGVYDNNDILIEDGFKTIIEKEKDNIRDILNFEKYLGNDLWSEFCLYRREDSYKNQNYISDGLDNSELISKALEFIKTAEKEIYKSATLQHSISSTLYNLLTIKKFKSIIEYFEVGNFIRVQVDDTTYKLRLLDYEINYDNLEDISVTFSDVMSIADGYSDQASILKQAGEMATSYDYIQHQANQGLKTKNKVDAWVTKGLSLTKMKIIDNADNQNITWDSHGILCREYLPITDEYSDKQLKIINKGLYLTDDGWLTSRAGIGNFTFYNPETKEYEESYGVIADTIVGNLILSEKVGVYNVDNSITLNQNGLTITTFEDANEDQMTFTIQKKVIDSLGNDKYEKQLYIDDDGNVVINGTFMVQSKGGETTVMNDVIESVSSSVKLSDSVKSVDVEYYLSSSNTELVDGEWNTNAPTQTYGKHIWSRTKTIMGDGTERTSEPICIVGGSNGKDGKDGINGKDGKDGVSNYIHIKYSSVPTPNDSQITETPSAYIGICIDYNLKDPTTASSYTWSKFEGTDGADGVAGKNGKDGTNSYVHFAYANSADGKTDFSVTEFADAKYLGVRTDNVKADSTKYTDYIWSKIKGEDGSNGKDGTSYYTHIKYSANSDGSSMVDTPTSKTIYIGTYTGTSKTAPTTTSSYKWSRYVGKTGNGINSISYLYMATTTNAQPSATDTKWSATIPTLSSTNKYVWAKQTIDFTDSNVADTVAISLYGTYTTNGNDGASITIKSTSVTYQESSSGTTTPTGTWSNSVPNVANGKYLWTKTVVVYSDNKSTTAYAVAYKGINGTKGDKGETGDTGTGIESITEEYYLSTSKEEQIGGSWITTPPTWLSGKYIWTRSKIIYKNPTSIVYTTPVCDSSWESSNIVNDRLTEEIKRTDESIEQTYEDLSGEILEKTNNVYDELYNDFNNQIINNREQIENAYTTTINTRYSELLDYTNNQLNLYKAEIGQYISFDNDGLTFGATSSNFKTIIDNAGMYFKEGDKTVAYINNSQLYIPDAVIENTFRLGKFFFSPRADGGVSLTWQED